MLPIVETSTKSFNAYKNIISLELFNEVRGLAKEMKGLKVVMINATPRGGGVAEILQGLVPLMKGLGIKAEWQVIPPRKEFFYLTKELHNALQGKEFSLDFNSRKLYQRYIEKTASLMLDDKKADVWVMHDPQPVGLAQYLSDSEFHPLISRIHIDTSLPNREAWNFIKGFLLQYDKIIFSSKDFVHKDIPKDKAVIMPPAIDPFTEKNKEMSLRRAKDVLKAFGIKTNKPLMAQISRFDPWKDPMGVIEAYRIAKKEIPDIQLALVGLFLASDDPEAKKVFQQARKAANHDPDIFLFSDPNYLGDLSVDSFVNAFQTGSDIVLQKSIKEGFGLTCTEAMWKGNSVIGGNVGGIKLQINNGKNGFLVSSPQEAAERSIYLLKNPLIKEKMGRAAKSTVKRKFLIPRLLRDYLKLFKQLL
jgi:trehalose synthase